MECCGCGELKKQIEEIRRKQEKDSQHMKEKQRGIDEKHREIDAKLSKMEEGIKEVFISALDRVESVFSKIQSDSLPTPDNNGKMSSKKEYVFRPPQRLEPPINHDVIVMGGEDANKEIIASVERYCCKEGRWIELAPMIMPRSSASSVVFDNQIIVSGGETKVPKNPKPVLTDSIEMLCLDKSPFTWVTSVAKLPVPVAGHVTLIYRGKLIVICNYQREEEGRSFGVATSKIFEVQLAPPHSTKELYTLPEDFVGAQAQLVEEKVFIFGTKPWNHGMVFIYDLVTNEGQRIAGLPSPLSRMSTVLWRNQVIVLGGMKTNGHNMKYTYETVDEVLMYDTETAESKNLPAMNHKRQDFSAVLADEVIIVIGGRGNTVEFYDFRTNTWQAFRAMKKWRSLETAVVSPV